MDRLARTRSQHFVHSPRRVGSPLKLRHNSTVNRHTTKRRRLGSNVNGHGSIRNGNIVDLAQTSDSEAADDITSTSKQRIIVPLSSEVGAQTINRHGRKSGNIVNDFGGAGKKDIKGKGKAVTAPPPPPPPESVIFSSEDGSSPRKRKRTHSGSEAEGDSSSWIELDEDEAEPEFIAEGDQHLIDDAPAYALHRLRKAELTRLWKVVGMWPGEEGEDVTTTAHDDEEDDKGLSKRELVDGLIAARKPSSTRIDSSSHRSPRHRNTLEAALEVRRGKSKTTSRESSASSDEGEADGVEATPKAVPRTRSKARVRVEPVEEKSSGSRRKPPVHGVRERLLKSRSKSMGGSGERNERRARFGENVQSPGKGLIDRRTRRASTQSSSAYTTTDDSPPTTPVNSRQTSRPPRRSAVTPAKRFGVRHSRKSLPPKDEEDDEMETVHSGSDSDEADPTPLIQRLRPRTKSFASSEHVSEADADGEDEPTESEGEDDASLFSPGPSSRLRSRSRTETDVPMSSDAPASGPLATREAKEKAKEAIRAVDVEVSEMDVDEPKINGHASPKRASPPKHKRHTRRNSRLLTSLDNVEHAEPASTASSVLSPPPPSSSVISTIDEDTETEAMRTTRSGRAFGVWQSRRKRLRQEAMDDPDMDVDDEEEAADSDEEEDESFENDVDLSDATIASLTRLLRDELVIMCEARGIEVGGTKPQLAKALLEWRDENTPISKSSTSSQATARPSSSSPSKKGKKRTGSSGKIIHAVGSNVHQSGQTTPVLLRDHVHAHDPATPQHSDDSKKTNGEAELNLDLQELGLEDSVIRPELLVKLERIGSGGFKDVYVGKYRGRKVAISEFREHLSEMDIRELKLLAEFSHPNIVKFRGICIPEDNSHIPCMLVSELCENGDLFDYIRNVDCPSIKRVLGLMLDIAKGLEYLHTHSPPIIHRDCKSSNILINRAGQAKVGDFGLARVKNSTRSMIRSLVGTVNWQAPELWSPKPQYDYKVDVFSAALVFWEMLSGWIGDKKYPWEGHNEHYIYDAVGQKLRRPSTAGLKKHWGAEPVNLMERMWHQDPKERPTMTDVVTDLEVLYAAA